jgi:hypothetical protein
MVLKYAVAKSPVGDLRHKYVIVLNNINHPMGVLFY